MTLLRLQMGSLFHLHNPHHTSLVHFLVHQVPANAIGNADMADVKIATNRDIAFVLLINSQSSLSYTALSLYFLLVLNT
jgi:hypothetical protein